MGTLDKLEKLREEHGKKPAPLTPLQAIQQYTKAVQSLNKNAVKILNRILLPFFSSGGPGQFYDGSRKEIAELCSMKCSLPVVTEALKRLEKAKLIERREQKKGKSNDATKLYPTPLLRVVTKMVTTPQGVVSESVTGGSNQNGYGITTIDNTYKEIEENSSSCGEISEEPQESETTLNTTTTKNLDGSSEASELLTQINAAYREIYGADLHTDKDSIALADAVLKKGIDIARFVRWLKEDKLPEKKEWQIKKSKSQFCTPHFILVNLLSDFESFTKEKPAPLDTGQLTPDEEKALLERCRKLFNQTQDERIVKAMKLYHDGTLTGKGFWAEINKIEKECKRQATEE